MLTALFIVLLTLLGAGIAILLYASIIERNWFAIRRHDVPCLPPGAKPIRILHLSDLHLRGGQRRKRRFLKGLAALKTDLLIVTGDLLGDAHSVPAVVDTVTSIPARTAALYVLGSNDYYSPSFKNPLRYFKKKRKHVLGKPNPWPELVSALDAKGWQLINNRALEIDGIDVVGLDDAHIGRADLKVARARNSVGFRLAVAHSPDGVEELAELGYDLIVCGHTHGGQIRVPGIGALVTNSTLPRTMARGLHKVGDAWLHVSAGLGTSMYAPYRLSCRPEVCVLDLVPGA
jgi:predicted MPP superfamily phosphohydrolase